MKEKKGEHETSQLKSKKKKRKKKEILRETRNASKEKSRAREDIG